MFPSDFPQTEIIGIDFILKWCCYAPTELRYMALGYPARNWKYMAVRAHNPKVGGSNPPPATKSEQSSLCSVFLCQEKFCPFPCSSSVAKSHVRFACSFVNALVRMHSRYRIFASIRLPRI